MCAAIHENSEKGQCLYQMVYSSNRFKMAALTCHTGDVLFLMSKGGHVTGQRVASAALSWSPEGKTGPVQFTQ